MSFDELVAAEYRLAEKAGTHLRGEKVMIAPPHGGVPVGFMVGPGSDLRAPSDSVRFYLAMSDVVLEGDLAIPNEVSSLVLMPQAIDDGRNRPGNLRAAAALGAQGCATLLVDLLTRDEQWRDAVNGSLRFDVSLLARRLAAVTQIVACWPGLGELPRGYFAASTAAAAALVAAGRDPRIGAVVSLGGRADLAGFALSRVRCPTLFIVGGAEAPALEMTRCAAAAIPAETEIRIVEGATHWFEEPNTNAIAASIAAEWFSKQLGQSDTARPVIRAEMGAPAALHG